MEEEGEGSIKESLKRIDDNIWEIPIGSKPGMNVPGRIYLSDKLIHNLEPEALDQVAKAATPPMGNP